MNRVEMILKSDVPGLEKLGRDIECEEHPDDAGAGERAEQGLRRSPQTVDS